jgi:L-fuconolactonase
MNRRQFLATGAAAMTASATTPLRIIDPHVHVWANDPRYPWAKETTKPPENDATPEMLIDLMKANGVAKTVIVQYIGYRWDNSYARDAVRKYPQSFQYVGRVNPEDPAAPDQLSREVERDGMKGVRLSPAASAAGDWIRGPLMLPLWKRCESLKVPMQILAPVTRMPDLVPLIEKCPDLTVVIDHMADSPVDRPAELEKLIALARFPKVFVKISHTWSISKEPYPWRDTWDHVKRLHAAFGPDRLMWGTDWPVCLGKTTYDLTLKVVRDEMTFLNANDRVWILSKSIERVWPFG